MYYNALLIQIETANDVNSVVFSGSRLRSKYDFSLRMYKEDVQVSSDLKLNDLVCQ